MTKKKPNSNALRNALIVLILIIVGISVIVFATTYPSTEEIVIALGDCADVEYIGRFAVNGTIFESTYTDVHNKTGGEPARIFVNPYFNISIPAGYEKYSATKVHGFLTALIGMQVGENKTVLLPPEDAFGIWNTTAAAEIGIGSYPLISVMSRTIEEDRTVFQYDFPYVALTENTSFDYGAEVFETSNVLPATIIAVTDTTITYTLDPVNNTTFPLPFFNWNVTLLVTNTTHFSLVSDIKINHTFSIEYFQPLHFKIVAVNETEATLAMNVGAPAIHFVDQPIIYEITVVEIHKTSQRAN